MTLAELMRCAPEETEERVDKARHKWNATIRSLLREETGLRLNFTSGIESSDASTKDSIAVPVTLAPGAPPEFLTVPIQGIDELSVLIGRNRMTLEALARSSRSAGRLVDDLCRTSTGAQLIEDVGISLEVASNFANAALELLKRADPLKAILNFDDDVLGHYRWQMPRWVSKEVAGPDPFRGHIVLYWGVIGVASALLDTSPEALTIVVMAHELAHAYTHVGADIDGVRWATQDFTNTDRELMEGLAQYYALRICERLRPRVPEACCAFHNLLGHQPVLYRSHVPWVKAESTPEHIRLAMIESRRLGPGRLGEFNRRLEEARCRLIREQSRGDDGMDGGGENGL